MNEPRGSAPEQQLADGFAEHAVGWARDQGAPVATLAVLREAACLVSLATSAGHGCVPIETLPAVAASGVDRVRALLVDSGVVGTAQQPGAFPLVLDTGDRLYLHRYYDYEQRLARRLVARDRLQPDAAADARVATQLHALFADNPGLPGGRVDWQKIGAALAYAGSPTIISGGPGTGKTTTVVNLLACLLAENPACRITLAAPTGKAAARMLDAVRRHAGRLPAAIRAGLPTESFTIHRLLGVTMEPGRFRHDATNPLPVDVLVVDEASMLDLALATRLFEAVPAGARIVLLGDKDQLAAVEAGAVFAELCADPRLDDTCVARIAQLTGETAARIDAPAALQPTPLHNHVVWFTENFRFAADSGIGRLAADIRAGNSDAVLVALRGNAKSGVEWVPDAATPPTASTLQRMHAGYWQYIAVVRAHPTDCRAAFAAFAKYRVLCAEREGPRGVNGINAVLAPYFRHAVGAPATAAGRSEWYAGRPVMVLRNDHVLKLFNGDVGIALPDESGALTVFFPQGEAGYRGVAPVRLPAHETAFATTVHKAQGNEFDEILVLLPAQQSRVATRELLYTAVTRARHRVTLVGSDDVIERSVSSPTTRHSGLVARLWEAAAERDGSAPDVGS